MCCRFDFEAKTLNVKGFYDKILIKCRYQLEGQVLQLPITGSGPAVITLGEWFVSSGGVKILGNFRKYGFFAFS